MYLIPYIYSSHAYKRFLVLAIHGSQICNLPMDVTYSLLVAVVTSISVLLIFTKFAIIRLVYSCVTWLKDIMYLHSLPSPPRRWLLGHALEVSMYAIRISYT